jgi:hypothetical protein
VTPSTNHSTHPLQCHPATPAGIPLDLSVAVSSTREGLRLAYTVRGHIAALRIASAAAPGPADGLWQHTCLEAFASADGDSAYREFNFSPSGQWAIYRFASERIRAGTASGVEAAPVTHTTASADKLTLTADLPWTALPANAHVLDIALSAVIEEVDGRFSYWALHHPGEHPDFHHPAGRCLHLALPQP